MRIFDFFSYFKKMMLVFLILSAGSLAFAGDKSATPKKISRNISSVESAMCPNNSPAPAGNIEFCPKCKNGNYRLLEGCPNEGGAGDSCPQGGCNGGMPTEAISRSN